MNANDGAPRILGVAFLLQAITSLVRRGAEAPRTAGYRIEDHLLNVNNTERA
jgi:hypothetical protein